MRGALALVSVALGSTACGGGTEPARERATVTAPARPPRTDPAKDAVSEAEPPAPPATAPPSTAAVGRDPHDPVAWQELLPFVPDTLDGFEANGPPDGQTMSRPRGGVPVVKRRYSGGNKGLRITISDTVAAPSLRRPFDTSAKLADGGKKRKTIEGAPALVEWDRKGKISMAMVLVGGRFLVDIRVTANAKRKDAETIATRLGVAKLATLGPA